MNADLDATIEKTRRNIEAAVLFELGMLYAPDDIGAVNVAFDGLALGQGPRRRLSVQVQLTVRDQAAPAATVPQQKPNTLWVMR